MDEPRRLTVTEYTALIAAHTAVQQAHATLEAIQRELGWQNGEEYDIQPDRFIKLLNNVTNA